MKLLNNMRIIVKRLLGRDVSPAKRELELLKKKGLKIGEKVDIFTDYPFDSLYPGLIRVGNYVTISSNVKILAHDASMGYFTDGACKIGIVDIGDRVFIGHGTTILCNVRIGNNAIIGAGSVVTTDVPAGTVYAGNPAKFISTTEEYIAKHKKALETKPTFTKPWREWIDLDNEEWETIKTQLKDSCGYIVREK